MFLYWSATEQFFVRRAPYGTKGYNGVHPYKTMFLPNVGLNRRPHQTQTLDAVARSTVTTVFGVRVSVWIAEWPPFEK